MYLILHWEWYYGNCAIVVSFRLIKLTNLTMCATVLDMQYQQTKTSFRLTLTNSLFHGRSDDVASSVKKNNCFTAYVQYPYHRLSIQKNSLSYTGRKRKKTCDSYVYSVWPTATKLGVVTQQYPAIQAPCCFPSRVVRHLIVARFTYFLSRTTVAKKTLFLEIHAVWTPKLISVSSGKDKDINFDGSVWGASNQVFALVGGKIAPAGP